MARKEDEKKKEQKRSESSSKWSSLSNKIYLSGRIYRQLVVQIEKLSLQTQLGMASSHQNFIVGTISLCVHM